MLTEDQTLTIDAYPAPSEAASKAARAAIMRLDKQYGAQWHCVIGKGFSYDVTAQCGSLL